MSEKKRRTCNICGRPYVPTSNVQKYCPDCRKQMQKDGSIKDAYLAYKKAGAPGPVTISHIETPEDMLQANMETRQTVGFVGSGGNGACGEPIIIPIEKKVKEIKRELPDWEGFVERASEILLAYGRGELIDKDEFIEDLREKLDNL